MSEKRLIRKYIKCIDINDIFCNGSFVDVIDNLLDEYSKLWDMFPTYINFEYEADLDISSSIQIYGYREETDEEISKYNANTKKQHDKDYAVYLELKKRFE